MLKIRLNASTEEANLFFGALVDFQNKGAVVGTTGKDYLNNDGTVRKYVDLDISKFNAELSPIRGTFLVSLRVTGDSKEEVIKMLDILSKLAVVTYIDKGKGLVVRKNHYGYGVMISCVDKAQAAKVKITGKGNDNFKIYA